MKVAFLYYNLYDPEGERLLIGGVETYLQRLMALSAAMGFDPVMFQAAQRPFERRLGPAVVVGVPVRERSAPRQRRALYSAALGRLERTDMIVFGADHCSVRSDWRRAVSIQHGVSWDLPSSFATTKGWCSSGVGAQVKKVQLNLRGLRFFDNCQNRVCVDYNFLNWYRAIRGESPGGSVWVIPNCCQLASHERIGRGDSPGTRVLFARRFTTYRGTRIMAEAIDRVLSRRTDVIFTLAGEGPDEGYLLDRFEQCENVRFTKYRPEECMEVHLAHDIAVVPSVASEGTSLSVAEAMGAGCAVVASAVGGITSMILDGFNGVLAMPAAEEFATAILRLAGDARRRREMGENAYRTAAECFDVGRWNTKWKGVLEQVAAIQP
jgi:glycosyltransferase involved in cell wall biosynthesis